MDNKIILIVGKSGSGKTTIVNKLEKEYGLKSILSYTTRPKRSEDEYGHIFITKDDFYALRDIVGYTEYGNNLYCATAQQVENNDLYIINPDGVDFFKRNYKGLKEVVVVYIVTDLDTHKDFNNRYERMISRGDTVADASYRVALDNFEFRNFEEIADVIIVNNEKDGLDSACYIINGILNGSITKDNCLDPEVLTYIRRKN